MIYAPLTFFWKYNMIIKDELMDLGQLLTQISNITKRYEEIYKFSGEKFNIFNILNLSRNEISHSRIIEELLNPNGTHGKDKKFLELFLKCIKIKEFSINNVITETEKFIGYISEDYASGGRIDIVITNEKGEQIVIENKIDAADGFKQLIRYHEHNKKAHLFYLTLYGRDPSEYSTGENTDIPYKRISYKEHILSWLELCRKESIDNPILRETITQYILLIKQLTGQARSEEMQEEYLKTIVEDVDNLSAAFYISQNINDIKLRVIKEKFIPLIEDLVKNKLGLEIEMDLGSFEAFKGFSIMKLEWKKCKIEFGFDKTDFKDMFYGFSGEDISQELNNYFRSLNYKSDKYWPLYQYMDRYRNWDEEFFKELYSNSINISNVFENKIKELLLIVKDKEHEL
jgi:hypothetical protein